MPVALGLGGNVGPVRRHLRHALGRLESTLGPLRVAPLYRTRPVSPLPQPHFLNTAAVGRTTAPPREILRLAKELERRAGRDFSAPPSSPRPLDVDLLVHGGRVSGDAELTLPHPRLRERAFVLVPLAEIAPDLAVPPDGRTVAELLAELRRAGGVEGVERVSWEEDDGNRRADGDGEPG